jgi:hypothetical protein
LIEQGFSEEMIKDVQNLKPEDQKEIANTQDLLEESKIALDKLKASNPKDPKIKKLEKKIEDLQIKVGNVILSSGNNNLLSNIFKFDPEDRKKQVAFKESMRETRHEIFRYIGIVFKVTNDELDKLDLQALNVLAGEIIKENKIDANLFF